jgi:hypothetical protein
MSNLLVIFAMNVFIGIFNMLPLPLDGGRAAVAIYGRVRSRRNRRYFADATGLACDLRRDHDALVVAVTALYLDVVNRSALRLQRWSSDILLPRRKTRPIMVGDVPWAATRRSRSVDDDRKTPTSTARSWHRLAMAGATSCAAPATVEAAEG